MREIVLDTETSGLSHKTGDRVIEVGCVELVNHIPTGNNLQFYCSTEKKIDESAIKVHGLTNAFLNKHPTFKKSSNKFLEFIKNDDLIIHNADFDTGFINNELNLIGIGPIKNRVIDTLTLARKVLNTRIANLDYLCRRFSIDLSLRSVHGAILDCQLLAEVYIELLGGRQTTLDFVAKANNNKNQKKDEKKQKNTLLSIQISQEEKINHNKFINKINNSLWKEIDY